MEIKTTVILINFHRRRFENSDQRSEGAESSGFLLNVSFLRIKLT